MFPQIMFEKSMQKSSKKLVKKTDKSLGKTKRQKNRPKIQRKLTKGIVSEGLVLFVTQKVLNRGRRISTQPSMY